MKITFIQPYYNNIWECLGIGYIISHIKHYHPDIEINFFQRRFDDVNTVLTGCVDSDIIAFSCTSPSYSDAIFLATHIKIQNKKAHIVFGGWHPTALPEDVIKEECIDQVIVGEGEHAMRLVVEGDREPILYGFNMNNDLLEWPDRKTIKNERTIDLCEKMNGQRTASFQMNRGCKVHCAFCAEHLMSGKYNKISNPIRTRHIGKALTEIQTVSSEYNLNYFKFADATFDISAEFVIDFCKTKISRKINIPFEANIHPGFVQKEEVFFWLKEAHCQQINIGCESGSQKVLNGIGKGTNIKQIKNVFKWAKSHGIKRRGYFLLGMIEENEYDIQLTDRLIEEIQPDVVGFTILAPYPGSDFYDSKKYKDIDWSVVGEYGNNFWRTRHLSNQQLKGYQKYFTDKYASLLCEVQRG